VNLSVSISSATASTALIDVEVYSPSGARVAYQVFDSQSFSAGQSRVYAMPYDVPSNGALGTYTVKVGVFSPGWGTLYSWNDRATQFSVR
jgi:hypothetical protein